MAGAAAYRNDREAIFAKIITHRDWPKGLFRGDEARIEYLRNRGERRPETETLASAGLTTSIPEWI